MSVAFGRAPPMEVPCSSAASSSGVRHAGFQGLGGSSQLLERRRVGSGDVVRGRLLEVEGAEAIRAGAQQVVDLAEVVVLAETESVADDAAAPSVRRAVAECAGDDQTVSRRLGAAGQRKLGREGDRPGRSR